MNPPPIHGMELALNNAVERAITWEIKATHTWIDIPIYYIRKTYEYVVLTPLSRLFLLGPSLGGFGFWNGQRIEDICAQKTSLTADFWKDHHMECVQIISKSFYGMVVLFETVIYFLVMWFIIKKIFWYIINNKSYTKHTAVKNLPTN